MIKSRAFYINLAAGLVFLILVVYLTLGAFNVYTRHGEKITVPDVTGMRIDKAQEELKKAGMRYQINDSVYMEGKPKMSVVEQDPHAGAGVKEDRIIYLVVNSRNAPLINIPDLVGKSQKQTALTLESLGFKIGVVSYRPDEVDGALMELRYNGKLLHKGEEVEKGSVIDLVVGKQENRDDSIPDAGSTPDEKAEDEL